MLIELANKLRCSMHRRCLRYYYSFVFNNPPFSPFLRVTLLQTLNISGKPYHSKILKTLISCLPLHPEMKDNEQRYYMVIAFL